MRKKLVSFGFSIIGLSMLFLGLLCAGCEQQKRPQPSTTIECTETMDYTGVKITYRYYVNNNGEFHVQLKNLEDIQKYRRELEFLLNRLDEVEKKISVREPKETVNEQPN